MRNLRRRWVRVAAGGLAALVLVGVAAAQSASSFDLSFSVIPGGGGAVAGGDYSALTTIAQPVAGQASGGSYVVDTGFQGGGSVKYRRFLPQLANDGSN